ncbi:isocitrate dehydrogenase [NAD] subunit 1, mitochondrial-like [Teleopsis dalmanni]|uniref:isocitrate dehydrogenase [NAD] subunit 1, mitochondrial-like n=1 Tax=Teleopsis dalmanni TaxID=139649 RepID=UPI0018CCAFD8|nr:isocitrate dehydrogenase [NAD] subunit 1, mitochondrial-like [Teleopsis dalmanni]
MYALLFRPIKFLSRSKIPHVTRTLTSSSEFEPGSFLKDKPPLKKLKLFPESLYGGEHFVTLLTGTSPIGKQGANYIKTLFKAAKIPVAFERIDVGNTNEYIRSVLRNRVCLHVDSQHDPQEKAKALKLNNNLDLFACIIKCFGHKGYNCKFPDANLTIASQNNTGDYDKLEYQPVQGVVETLCIHEDDYTRRYLKFVLDYAKKNGHKHITIGVKRLYLPRSDGRFFDLACEIQQESYPDIELLEMDIEKLVYYIIKDPCKFDMICCNDRYGTFVASAASAVCGGASLFGACELNNTHAIFKPLQTKLSITSYRELSPYGVIRSCIDLLRYLGKCECATAMEGELASILSAGKPRTVEFGGEDSGEFIICNIVNKLRCKFK